MSGEEDKGGAKPGAGYAVEISSLRKILTPMEESMTAARKIKNDWKPMADHINESATFDIVKPARDLLSGWGYGMGRVAEHADAVVETLRQVIAAYMLADLLRIKDFEPTADNIAKLPWGDHAMRSWQAGNRPKFDPAPEIYQEPWLTDNGRADGKTGGGDGDGVVTGDPPSNPRKLYDGGWVTDGGKGTIA
ncbi:hypothetical protein [Streptomyces sp. NPDC048172]|uniref:hypothetical protein n=1 Tax=Streptomyces sp. NPDC048172 TaxID=3365505 RepID=UPI00371A3CC1